MSEEQQAPQKPGLKQVIGSVLASVIGVQSAKNKERDFQQGSFKTFVIAAIVFTVLFVAALAGLVSVVLSAAQ